MDVSCKLNYIKVAYRDGKTEYELFDSYMWNLLLEKEKHKLDTRIDEKIKKTQAAINYLEKVKFSKKQNAESKAFESYISHLRYVTPFDRFKDKYVVLDVETNGIRKTNDDLLSISIYDPTSGKCYNRFLPLDLQPLVLTGWIHGISDEQLMETTHISQDELNKLIDFFDLKNKIILSFSGGKGIFDSAFFINYCKRNNITGFENLRYENIKTMLPKANYGLEGQMSKDNLCRLFKIQGIQSTHSSMNDCLLEWKLFEKINLKPVFFIGQHLFAYDERYIVPISYLDKNPQLVDIGKINIPHLIGKAEIIFNFSLPKNVINQIKKFPTNITGIALENGINFALGVEKQDNSVFLTKNKSYLKYIGSLDSRIAEIPVVEKEDGTMRSLVESYDNYVDEVNKVTKLVTCSLNPLFEFIRQNIFINSKILSQELVVSEDGKVLALCDLSDEESVFEIKTFDICGIDGMLSDSLTRQLYYQSKGRKTYVLSIHFDMKKNIVIGLDVRIYKIFLEKM